VRERREAQTAILMRGVGLGLRWDFIEELVERSEGGRLHEIDFLEIAPENYMRRGGWHPRALTELARRYPLLTHGLTLSLGGTDPLDAAYMADLRALAKDVGTPWHSDHLCFGDVDGRNLHDLLPLGFRQATVRRVADRIRWARDALGVPLAVENVSYYWHPGRAEMGEAEFIARVCETADCGLMLDLNNAFVNSQNFRFDLEAWISAVPLDRVVQIHVAGHEWFAVDATSLRGPCAPPDADAIIIDTHGADVLDPVLALLGRVLRHTGPIPVVLERDQNVPDLDTLLSELARVRRVVEGSDRVEPTSGVVGSEQHASRPQIGQ
jgi:uncharacterized protein (UPF0276 family)